MEKEIVKTDKRFELHIDGHIAFIDYLNKGDKIALIHTEVPQALSGKGIGVELVLKTLVWLENHGIQLIPICPFVKKYLDKNPEWYRIVVESYRPN